MSWKEEIKKDNYPYRDDFYNRAYTVDSPQEYRGQQGFEMSVAEALVEEKLTIVYKAQMEAAIKSAKEGRSIAELKDELVNALDNELELADSEVEGDLKELAIKRIKRD